MRHFADPVKQSFFLPCVFALALVAVLIQTGCATAKKDIPAEKPTVEEPMDVEVDAQKAAYLRDIRPRVVTYDGNFSEMGSDSETSLEEEFSTGEFIPRSDLF